MIDIQKEQRKSSEIWDRVDNFRRQGEVAIAGMSDTDENWLNEYAKHQAWLQYANSIWPGTEGVLNDEEVKTLEAMRQSNPSDEDQIWEELDSQLLR